MSELDPELAEVWNRLRSGVAEDVRAVAAAVAEAASGTLGEEARKDAVWRAHKLAGSLGSVGLQHGTEMAFEAERLVRGNAGGTDPDDLVRRLEELAAEISAG